MSGYENEAAAVAGLAAARKVQNLTVADAARQLKLSVAQVEALETGAFDKLPGPVFVRGFLRNYARLLKLDADEVLRAVSPELPVQTARGGMPASQEIPFPSGRPRRWPQFASALVLLVGGVVAYELYLDQRESTVIKPAPRADVPKVVAAPAAAPVVAGATGSEQNARSPVADNPVAPIATATPPAAVQEVNAAAAGAIEAPQTTPAAQPAQAGDNKSDQAAEREILLAFDKSSWVEVRDGSGKIIFSKLNQPGTEQHLRGIPPLSLIIGNAHGVRVRYDDNPLDLQQYTKVDVARFTLE